MIPAMNRPLAELQQAIAAGRDLTQAELLWLAARAERAAGLEAAAERLQASKDELAAAVAWGRLKAAAKALLARTAGEPGAPELAAALLEIELALGELEALRGRVL